MPMQNDIFSIGATRVVVGASQILKVTAAGFQYAETLKIISGGGTLELISAANYAGGTGWGSGYPIGANEFVNIGGPAVFYLAASGATMTAALYLGYTAGASTA